MIACLICKADVGASTQKLVAMDNEGGVRELGPVCERCVDPMRPLAREVEYGARLLPIPKDRDRAELELRVQGIRDGKPYALRTVLDVTDTLRRLTMKMNVSILASGGEAFQ